MTDPSPASPTGSLIDHHHAGYATNTYKPRALCSDESAVVRRSRFARSASCPGDRAPEGHARVTMETPTTEP